MPPFESIIAVSLAGFALSATPGPSMLYVLSRSVGQSHVAGLASAIGLGFGGVVLAILTAFGLAALLNGFPWTITVLRYVGSAYLIYLGVNMIFEARKNAMIELKAAQVNKMTFRNIVWQGVLVEFLNPKTVLFFALFVPPFVTAAPDAQAEVQLQLLILGILVPLTAMPSDIIVAYIGGTLTQSLNNRRCLREGLAWAGGIILVLIAMNLHFPLL